MSDSPAIRSSPPPGPSNAPRFLLSSEPSEARASLVPEQSVPIVVNLISSDDQGDPTPPDVPLPVHPAEFSDLVDYILSPPPFQSNQQAQQALERAERGEEAVEDPEEYELTDPSALKRKRATEKGKERAHESVPISSPELDPTSVISSDPDLAAKVPKESRLQVIAITSSDAIKQAVAVWSGKRQPSNQSKNATIQFNNIRTLLDTNLAYPGQDSIIKKYGHCKFWMNRERKGATIQETPKLIEGGTNNDAPRVSFTFPGVKAGTKFYTYHVVAIEAILSGTNKHLSMSKLEAVSKHKNEANALTVVHLCGHKWCLNADHYRIRTKKYNDQQVFCHFGLQSAVDHRELKTMRDFYCKHTPNKCWTINYGGDFASGHVWEEGVLKKAEPEEAEGEGLSDVSE